MAAGIWTIGTDVNPNRRYSEFPSTTGQIAGASFEEALTGNLVQTLEDRYYTSEKLKKQGTPLSAEEARSRLEAKGLQDQLQVPDEGVTDAFLEWQMDRKLAENRRKSVWSRSQGGFVNTSASIAAGLAGGMLDPVNAGLSFVPLVGQARYMKLLANAKGPLGRAGVRFGTGAAEGAAASIAVEPAIYTMRRSMQDDYTMTDALLNVGFGTLVGGGLRGMAGGIGDVAAKATGKPRSFERYAGLEVADIKAVRGFESRIAAGDIDPKTMATELRSASTNVQRYFGVDRIIANKKQSELQAKIAQDYPNLTTRSFDNITDFEPQSYVEAKAVAMEELEVEIQQRLDQAPAVRSGPRRRAGRQVTDEEIRNADQQAALRKDLETLRRGEVPDRLQGDVEARVKQVQDRFQRNPLAQAVRDAYPSAARQVAALSHHTHEATLRTAVGQMVEGRLPNGLDVIARTDSNHPGRAPTTQESVAAGRKSTQPEQHYNTDRQASRQAKETVEAAPKNLTELESAEREVQTYLEDIQELEDALGVKWSDELAEADEALAKTDEYRKVMRYAATVCNL